ncbi:MAG: hypothetical protein GVY26_21410 [Bacteroidetes bacterium]|jgi:hypothetical protein|nr:hypothetical protein [Bacteroidota bacterium]
MDNKITTLIGLIALSVLAACTTSPTAELMQRGQITTPAFRDTLPFEMRNDYIVVRAQLNGRPMAMDFVWAPGALHSTLSEESVSYLGLDSLLDRETGMLLVDKVAFGEVVFEGHAFEVKDYPVPAPARCIAQGGILGSNLLRHCNWVVDFDAQQIVFMDKAQFATDPPAHRLPFKTHKVLGTPLIKAEVAGHGKQQLAVDLGYSGGLALSLEKAGQGGTVVYDAIAAGILETQSAAYRLHAPSSLRAGDWQVDLPVVTARAGEARLGNQIWQHYKVGLNFQTEELWLWPREEAYQPQPQPLLGWLPRYDKDGGLSVGYLVEGSPAWEAGLRIGDKISVLGRRAAPAVFNDYCTYLFTVQQRFGQDDQIILQLEKSEQPVRISLQSQ